LAPLVVLAIASSLISPAGRHQWALSLFRQETPTTTLFFNKAWTLPSTAVARAPLSVSFTIDNEEGRAVNYRYVLSVSDGKHSRVLRKSARIVDAGQAWTVSTVIRPACDVSRCHVEVSLPGYPETIDFLVTLKARKPGAGGRG
jgi:hypothetical protein